MKTFEIKNVIGRSQTMQLNKALPKGVRFSKVRNQYFVVDAAGTKHEVGHHTKFDVNKGIVSNVRSTL